MIRLLCPFLVLLAGTALARAETPSERLDARALAATIDRLVAAEWARAGVKPAPPADDAAFLRRVTLDLTGRIPSVAEVRAFLADRSPDKREKAVDRLLNGPGYVRHAVNVWKALLLPEESPGNFQLRALVPSFEAWLKRQFGENVPYDRMVRELVTTAVANNDGRNPRVALRPDGITEVTPLAFFQAKEMKPEELAAATSRLFLGVKLECAQCHNHPFAKWSRQQFWEFAAFFAGIQGQPNAGVFGPVMDRIDRREIAIPNSKQVVRAAFLDGRAPRWQEKVSPRVTLAEWLTSADNPWFARAAANRLWAHFFGLGIVEPVDDLSDENNRPSHPELLDTLGRQFVANAYDLKYLIRAITLSHTYQLSSTGGDAAASEPRLFARMTLKGLSADQLFDSLVQATGYREPRSPNPAFALPTGPRAEFATRFATPEKRTEAQTSILQALALMNGRFVANATSVQRSEFLGAIAEAPYLDDAGRVEALFLATLSRPPRPDEKERLVAYVRSGGPTKDSRAALGDVFWALLNSSEFILNH